MKRIPFYKMSGSGNDFILIDNREGTVGDHDLKQLIVGACRRKLSAGADGLILIEKSDRADFKWRFYNADGSRAEMCGNGARCAGRFAYLKGIAGPQLAFETDAGLVQAEIDGGSVKIRMTDPHGLTRDGVIEADGRSLAYDFINTGVPHVVTVVSEIDAVDVVQLGRAVRCHPAFAPAGVNVNFVQPVGKGTIAVRTYERGVEDETLACGTGSVAAALVMCLRKGWESPVAVKTRSGGILTIFFRWSQGGFSAVYLEGDARVIYEGLLWEEAWERA